MSVIRLVYLIHEYDHVDFTYDNTALTYWTCIEVNTAIVCACVMTLKPLINRYLPSLVQSRMSAPSGNTDALADSGGLRPLTIGSMPVRKGGGQANNRRRSWLVLPDRTDTDALMVDEEEEEELELMGLAKGDMETHLDRKIGLPTRPESMYIRDPRSPSAASTDGPEVRPSSAR